MRFTLPIVLHNPKVLLIGAGAVAAQKAEVMLRNQITFDVIAETRSDLMPSVDTIQQRRVSADDLAPYPIIIDATGNPEVTQMLLNEKAKRPFMLNVVDAPEHCDFFFAALLEYGPLKVAVSSSGGSPTLAQQVRDKIDRMLPKSLETLGHTLQQKRHQGIIDIHAARNSAKKALGKVSLVGCGTGDVELLTLKAYRVIQEADVVFVDHLISDEIEATIPERTLRISVGKRKGHHSVKQEAINAMLIDYAAKGYEVARLKAGDPYIFGRGAEEAQALIAANIRVDVIPGVSSAIAGPLSAGIAPTARGYATNLSVVSAHLSGNRFNREWIDLLTLKNHTTIVLMGLSRAEEIVKAAIEKGADPQMPTAIVSNASRPNQTRVITTLARLAAAAETAERPGIIVFGDVVNLHAVLPQHENLEEELLHDKIA
ncbi:uroporphyrinogen-III C-methyltransferase [Sulfurimonas sp. HSL3-7]|uniref:uroporphyrinogen-III C-methyltransferase n=1 Tax=Sulfonitrofixus jiaomeiensis TaxID=3131938 RepID=UPI0031F9EE28